VLRTPAVTMQLLAADQPALAIRHTAGTVHCCLDVSGWNTVDGIVLGWSENDIFVAPGWAWREHEATHDAVRNAERCARHCASSACCTRSVDTPVS
jgi:gentisate 1,2-dioxygenase